MGFTKQDVLDVYMPMAQQVEKTHGIDMIGPYMEVSFLAGMADILFGHIKDVENIKKRDDIISEFRMDMVAGWEALHQELTFRGLAVPEDLATALPTEPQAFVTAMRLAKEAFDNVLAETKEKKDDESVSGS